jgi:hypothetical protein
MNSLADHTEEFQSGLVTEAGFRALADAEVYGNVSSIGALRRCLSVLHSRVVSGHALQIQHPEFGASTVGDLHAFTAWQQQYFPSATISSYSMR